MTDLGNQNKKNEKKNENKKIIINHCPARELDLEYLQMEHIHNAEDKEHGYQPFAIKHLQNYQTIVNYSESENPVPTNFDANKIFPTSSSSR